MTWAPRSCDVCSTVFEPHSYQQLRCGQVCMDAAARAYQGARIRLDRQDTYANWVRRLRNRYGITVERYEQALAAQGGGCAVCGGLNRGRKLEVDHDHGHCPGERGCGECFRGLLCGPCNKALGQLRDDPAMLRRAAEYLEAHRVDS